MGKNFDVSFTERRAKRDINHFLYYLTFLPLFILPKQNIATLLHPKTQIYNHYSMSLSSRLYSSSSLPLSWSSGLRSPTLLYSITCIHFMLLSSPSTPPPPPNPTLFLNIISFAIVIRFALLMRKLPSSTPMVYKASVKIPKMLFCVFRSGIPRFICICGCEGNQVSDCNGHQRPGQGTSSRQLRSLINNSPFFPEHSVKSATLLYILHAAHHLFTRAVHEESN